MKGLGTDEEEIIQILTTRSNRQRQEIAAYFTNELNRDLIDDLKGELGGNFESVIVALMTEPDQYLCQELNKAMDGAGTNENVLVEILCTKTNDEVKRLVEVYEESESRFYYFLFNLNLIYAYIETQCIIVRLLNICAVKLMDIFVVC